MIKTKKVFKRDTKTSILGKWCKTQKITDRYLNVYFLEDKTIHKVNLVFTLEIGSKKENG